MRRAGVLTLTLSISPSPAATQMFFGGLGVIAMV